MADTETKIHMSMTDCLNS